MMTRQVELVRRRANPITTSWFTFQRRPLFPWLEEALGPLGER